MTNQTPPLTGHTPGNWQASDPGDYGDYDGDCIVVLDDIDAKCTRRVCVVLGSDDEAKANACLIAAAPELLAACKAALVGVCEAHGFQAHILTQIQAAIAKAEGRE